MAKLETVEITLTHVRETKGTHFYKEDDTYEEPAIRSLYLTKATLINRDNPPKKIKVTIEEVEE